jgi:hypothetical protein
MAIERKCGQLQAGAPPKKRKPAYIHVDNALKRLRCTYFGPGFPSVARFLTHMDRGGSREGGRRVGASAPPNGPKHGA